MESLSRRASTIPETEVPSAAHRQYRASRVCHYFVGGRTIKMRRRSEASRSVPNPQHDDVGFAFCGGLKNAVGGLSVFNDDG